MDRETEMRDHHWIVSQSLRAIRCIDVRCNDACILLEVTASPEFSSSALNGLQVQLQTRVDENIAYWVGQLQQVTLTPGSVMPGFRYVIPTASGPRLLTQRLRFTTSGNTPRGKETIYRFWPAIEVEAPPPSSRRRLVPCAIVPANIVESTTWLWKGQPIPFLQSFPNRYFTLASTTHTGAAE